MEILFKYMRSCAFCGNSWGKVEWLCKGCEENLLKRIEVKNRKISECIEHQYLIDWFPGDSFVNQLVYSLKGPGLIKTYQNLAIIFSSFQEIKAPSSLFYPSKGERDHGYQWGVSFSDLFNCSLTPLIKEKSLKQASLSYEEREGLRFQEESYGGQKPCFVDDIVTSGSTAKSAHRALGQPVKLTVWSLFYRRNL